MSVKREFFLQPTEVVARRLIGRKLVVRSAGRECGGVIVETEAYLGAADPAAHSYRGETPRTQVMFGDPGHVYVYFIYGMHICLNIVTAQAGVGHAVLIRALEPTMGLDLMRQRRGRKDVEELCSGPAKLTQALGITLADNGADLLAGQRIFLSGQAIENAQIKTSRRIGIKKAADWPLRFYLSGSPFVSG